MQDFTQHPAGATANGGAVPLDVPLFVEGEEAGSSPSQVQIARLPQWRKVCTCLGLWTSDETIRIKTFSIDLGAFA